MSAFLVLMHLLVFGELPLLAAALLLFRRLETRHRLRFLQGYLLARIVPACVCETILLFPGRPGAGALLSAIYFYAWFAGSFAATWYLYLLSRETVTSMLGSCYGLRRLTRTFFVWLLVPAGLLVAPTAAPFLASMGKTHSSPLPLERFLTMYSLAQLLPVLVAFALGLRLGLTRRHRPFGILLGLMLEPCVDLLISLSGLRQLWGWQNLIRQIVTDGVLVLWIVYFIRPFQPGPVVEADATLLRWDAVARQIAQKDMELVVSATGTRPRGPARLPRVPAFRD